MESLFKKLANGLTLISGAVLLLMMMHVTLDVALKNLFNAPFQGTVEISSYYYMVAVVMLPMALVEINDEQISVDLLFGHLPAILQKALLLVTFLATACVLALMTWRTGLDAIRAFRVGEVVMGSREVVVWPARCLLPLGFGLASIAALLRAAMLLRGRRVLAVHHEGATE